MNKTIDNLKKLKSFHNGSYGADIDKAIKALEQQDVLDKIRKEIVDWQTDIHDNEYDANKFDFVFERILEIIDEHRVESEGEK